PAPPREALLPPREEHRARGVHDRSPPSREESAEDLRSTGALRAIARDQEGRRGHPRAQRGELRRVRRADDRADARETRAADELLPPLDDGVRDALVELRRAVVLERRAPRVRGADEDEDPLPVLRAGLEERADRVAAEVGAHRDRVAAR